MRNTDAFKICSSYLLSRPKRHILLGVPIIILMSVVLIINFIYYGLRNAVLNEYDDTVIAKVNYDEAISVREKNNAEILPQIVEETGGKIIGLDEFKDEYSAIANNQNE